jgi:glycyl-tRNA synthetase beta subunit
MQTLQIHILIENMPRYEQKFGVNIFFDSFMKNLEENKIFTNLMSCGSGVSLWFAQISILKFNTEKRISGEDEYLHSRYPMARFEILEGKQYAIIEEEGLERRIIDAFEKTMRTHQWSSSMHFGSYSCVRPIRKISIKLDKKFLSGQYASVVLSSLEIEQKFFHQKKSKIYKLLEEYFVDTTSLNEKIIEENCASSFDPISLIIEFEKTYLDLPFDLLEKTIEEMFGFSVPLSNKCIIFTEKVLKINKENFEKVINSKLHDVYITFQKDIECQNLSSKSFSIFLGNNLGTVREKVARMKNIAKEMNIQDLDHLIDLYYYDLAAQTVQSHPSLKGVVIQKIMPEGKIVRNAHKGSNDFISLCLKSLECIDNIMLLPMYTSTKDPFSIKRQVDFLIEFFQTTNLCFNFREKNDVFLKRTKARLKDHRKFLHAQNLEEQISILNITPFFLSSQKITRILNIVKSAEKSENIILNEKFDDITKENLEEMIEKIIHYIENNKISPYIERIEMIEHFINQLYSIIDLKSLLQEG